MAMIKILVNNVEPEMAEALSGAITAAVGMMAPDGTIETTVYNDDGTPYVEAEEPQEEEEA